VTSSVDLIPAWQVHELGEPGDVLRLDMVARPAPQPGRTILRVDACALNFPYILLCRGRYQAKPPLPFTPGMEIAGHDPQTGQRYAALCELPNGGLVGEVSIEDAKLFPVPDSMPIEAAASLAVTYQTGYVALHHRGNLQEGETLLVHAGAGGVGSAAIQLGLAAGARVIATAGGPDKVEVCRQLGADLAIDYTTDDFVAAVNDATNGRGADVIYDSVGGDTYTRSTKCIAFEGRILIIGFAGGEIAQAATNHILIKNYSVIGLHWGLYASKEPERVPRTHAAILELWEMGKINPLVADIVPMSEAPAALERLATRQTVGKVVVRMHHQE
jgi:NADPH2:quinone reductase